jgi:hypothetical protein
MAPPFKNGLTITYELIHDLTDVEMNTVYQAGAKPKADNDQRQRLDINSLESVILWVAAHGKTSLRLKICGYSAQSLVEDGVLHGAPKKPSV